MYTKRVIHNPGKTYVKNAMEDKPLNFLKTMTGVPQELFPHVISFCSSISSTLPIYITVTAGLNDVVKECIPNVRRRTEREGGEIVFGWQIWEWYGIMIEAEFHALWQDQKNILHDVTPKDIPCEKILFLPDQNLVYNEQQINNIRHSLIANQKVHELIQIEDSIFEIHNKGERAQMQLINLTDEETLELRELKLRQSKLFLEIMNSTPNRNDFCRCGSGKKYKKCHG